MAVLMLFISTMARRFFAACNAPPAAGMMIAANTAMMAMTTRISTSVNPRL